MATDTGVAPALKWWWWPTGGVTAPYLADCRASAELSAVQVRTASPDSLPAYKAACGRPTISTKLQRQQQAPLIQGRGNNMQH